MFSDVVAESGRGLMSSREVTICIAPNPDPELANRIGQLDVRVTDDPGTGNALVWTGGSHVERMAEHLRPNLEWVSYRRLVWRSGLGPDSSMTLADGRVPQVRMRNLSVNTP